MDPRRARDPRLARVDPRLQRVPSGSPVPTPTPPSQNNNPQFSTQWMENGTRNSAAVPPQPPSDFQEIPTSEAQGPQIPVQPDYKPRPLFCVVCASNQARLLWHGYIYCLLNLPRIDQWKVILFYRECALA